MLRRITGTLLMIVFLLGTVVAMAGGDFTELDVSISNDGNGKSVKAEIESMYEVRLEQTGPIRFMMQPNGEVIVPLWLEIGALNISPTQGTRTPVSLENATVNLLKTDHIVKRKTLHLLIDLIQADGMKYRVYIPEAIDRGHTVKIAYKGNGFTSAYGLRVEEPEFKGVHVNQEESRHNYLVLEMEKGVPIPYPSKWTFYATRYGYADTPAKIDAIEGWMRKDGNGRYLPPNDVETLAQYPELKNKCIVTFTHFNEDGTSCFFVIEGRWPDEA